MLIIRLTDGDFLFDFTRTYVESPTQLTLRTI